MGKKGGGEGKKRMGGERKNGNWSRRKSGQRTMLLVTINFYLFFERQMQYKSIIQKKDKMEHEFRSARRVDQLTLVRRKSH